jgi:opacity protein-like surface antigen
MLKLRPFWSRKAEGQARAQSVRDANEHARSSEMTRASEERALTHAWRIERCMCGIAAIFAAALVSAAAHAQSDAASATSEQTESGAGIYPIVGARWFEPIDSELRDHYRGGAGFAAGLGMRLGERTSAEAQIEWFRSSDTPTAPPFVERTESTLTLLPISAMLRYQIARGGDGLFLLVGPALLRQKESFSYSLLDQRDTVSGTRTGFGVSFGLGWEAIRRPLAYRIVARATLASVKRSILRSGAPTLETEETIAPSLAGIGLEVRLP